MPCSMRCHFLVVKAVCGQWGISQSSVGGCCRQPVWNAFLDDWAKVHTQRHNEGLDHLECVPEPRVPKVYWLPVVAMGGVQFLNCPGLVDRPFRQAWFRCM